MVIFRRGKVALLNVITITFSRHYWRTTYYHQMPSHQAIIDWVTATGLRPWLQDLSESEQQHFLTRYHQMLEEQYPLQENGQILLAFPRLFIVARRRE